MNRSMAVYLATTLMMATGSGPAREPKEPATATANASSEVLDACALVAASDIRRRIASFANTAIASKRSARRRVRFVPRHQHNIMRACNVP